MNLAATSQILRIIRLKTDTDSKSLSQISSFFEFFTSMVQNCTQALSRANQQLASELHSLQDNLMLIRATQPFNEFLTSMVSGFCLLVQQIDSEILDPLSEYSRKFADSAQQEIQSISESQTTLRTAYTHLQTSKERYYNESTAHRDHNQSNAMSVYMAEIDSLNKQMSQFQVFLFKSLNRFDESHIKSLNFQKEALQTYAKFNQVFLNGISMRKNSEIHLQKPQLLANNAFCQLLKSKLSVGFVPYSQIQILKKQDSKQTRETIENALRVLIESQTVNKSLLQEMLKTPNLRQRLLKILVAIVAQPQVTEETLQNITLLFMGILSTVKMKDAQDKDSLHIILVLASKLHASSAGQKTYVADFLAQTETMHQKSVWVDCMEHRILTLMGAESQRAGPMSLLKGFAKTIQNRFGDQTTAKISVQKLCTMVCTEYKYYMRSLKVTLELGLQVMLAVAKKCKLDSTRTCQILTEATVLLTTKNAIIPKPNAENRWGYLLPIASAIKFLSWTDVQSVLLVSKNWNCAFSNFALRQELLRLDVDDGFDNRFRSGLWSHLLARNSELNYCAILEQARAKDNEFRNIIHMDIERSFRKNTRVSPDAQKNILVSVAHACPSVGYCQGMNYISGLLYSQYQDEEMAFKSFMGLIKSMKLTEMLDSKLSNSLLYFYKIDRLLLILLPEIHEVFCESKICSIHFASPWIITIFISTFKDCDQLLLKIWDYFIAKGWKAVFRIVIALLEVKRLEILSTPTDELIAILSVISEDQQRELASGLIERLEGIPVTNKMLRILEREYYEIRVESENCCQCVVLGDCVFSQNFMTKI